MSNEPDKIIYSMIRVTKRHGQKEVLKDISLSYFYGAKIGVLGLNGSGKSSLLRILAGVDQSFDGKTVLAPGHTIGYLEQEPLAHETRTVREVVEDGVSELTAIARQFEEINANYRDYQWAWTYQMICDYYGISDITLEDANRIHEDYIKARRSWIAEIRKDAEKEFAMGDVEEEVFRNFVDSLDQEIEYEN